MEKDTEKTEVVFLISRNPYTHEKEAVAYFPKVWWNPCCHTHTAYMHNGQHGAATEEWAAFCDIPDESDAELVAALKAELDGIGYNLTVLDSLEWVTDKQKWYEDLHTAQANIAKRQCA